MPDIARFIVFMAAAFLLFVGVLLFVVRNRIVKPSAQTILALGAVVVILGMIFARYSHVTLPHLPWEIYYGLPALTTLLLPPVWLRMSRWEILYYLPLALFMAPAIHVIFSFLIGWHDYMPFPFYIPSLAELIRRSS